MTTEQIILPSDNFRLEEINLPEELATSLAGREITVDVLPEEPPLTCRLDLNKLPDGLPISIDDNDVAWNAYSPPRVLYTDAGGRAWRLPRHRLSDGVTSVVDASRYEVTDKLCWHEIWCPPTWWDLCDINIPGSAAAAVGEGIWIEVTVAPGEIPTVCWKDSSGTVWRIPHDWRRRRINPPDCDGLLRNNLPKDIAEEFGGRIVSVNYHPGSLCCLRDGYRVRDGRGSRWPVKAADCVAVGFGDEAERCA